MGYLDYDYLFKVHVVGNGTVGKTTMINRFIIGDFDRDYKTTIGSQFAVKLLHISNNVSAYLQIWDIAGEARFSGVRRTYYRGTSGIILVYDITREVTFSSVRKWILEGFEATSYPVPVAIVGNKTDLTGTPHVDPARGSAYADAISEEFDVPTLFLETSAKTGVNIDFLFREFSETLVYEKKRIGLDTDFRDTLDSRLETTSWKQIKMNLVCHDTKYVLTYLGFPELSGLLVSKEEIFGVLLGHDDIHKGIDSLWEFLMTRLEKQVKGRGPTFDLDIDRLSKTEAALYVDDIIALRFEEIRPLATLVKSGFEISPLALWGTYYGRMLIRSIGNPRESDLQQTRKLLLELEAAGVSTGLNS